MRRRLRAAWLVLLAGVGCESIDKAGRTGAREQELLKLNESMSPDRQVVPRTAREQNDPLLIDPASWAAQEGRRRP
jgi:hypothetical protein